MQKNLDIGCLRTFVMIDKVGSFAEASARVGRTAPAVSLQISRLEDQVGAKLFTKQGRRMVLSPAGEQLLLKARQILDLNDQVIESFQYQGLTGQVALGATQDIADSVLPRVLRRFAEAHPEVQLTCRVDRTQVLAEAVRTGALDLAVGVAGVKGLEFDLVKESPMAWLGPADFRLAPDQPVPLVLFEAPCLFRGAALKVLRDADRPYEITFSSPSLSGLKAAVEAGMGLTVRPANSLPNLIPIMSGADLPDLPEVQFALYTTETLTTPAERLAALMREELHSW